MLQKVVFWGVVLIVGVVLFRALYGGYLAGKM